MISRLFLILLPFCSLSHAMASEVTDYLQEQAQAFVLDQLDIPLDAQADVKAGTIDERLPLTRCEGSLSTGPGQHPETLCHRRRPGCQGRHSE